MKDWDEDCDLEEKEEAKVKGKLKVNVANDMQSEEEIQKYTLDDKQPLAKNILLLLASGTQDQKTAVDSRTDLAGA